MLAGKSLMDIKKRGGLKWIPEEHNFFIPFQNNVNSMKSFIIIVICDQLDMFYLIEFQS